ncbi:Fe(3+) dicitrate ABC transporter substrate-binding protein [Marinomonas sp. 2405UD66-6]|uniref:Fe(3+) dicitrate ABC transporter substrate-binding protein n=1 Tax=Marinomonas sp. 2405UD66-6 TaxID=3391834 RepID=UPI0039C99CF6
MKRFFAFVSLLLSMSSFAVTVQDSQGDFHIDYVPQRIVVLEYSFVDALAIVGVSPIGIADDKDTSRIASEIRELITPWESVGTRSQPSLEVISSLKPDLIIADYSRHQSVYKDLQKIAPTLILPSRRESYQGNLAAAAIIGKVLDKEDAMQARLAKHQEIMSEYAAQLPKGIEVQFGNVMEKYASLHPGKSYVGTLLQSLGFKAPPMLKNELSSVHTGLEQLLASNPEYLILGHYSSSDIANTWEKSPLWKALKAVRNDHVYHIYNPSIWSRSRGIIAAEIIAGQLVELLTSK